MSTNTELTAYQEPSLLADLQKYAASYPVAWARLKEGLPDPSVATDEDTAKVTDLLTKGKARYKELSERRLEFTRKLDLVKKELIDHEAILDESKPVSPLFEAKGFLQKVANARLEKKRKDEQEALRKLEEAKALEQIPIRFESMLKQMIIDLQTATKVELQKKVMLAGSEDELAAVEDSLRSPIAMTPEKYRELGNQAVKSLGASGPVIEKIVERNNAIKSGLILAFGTEMRSFQKELLTQIEPRRAAILQGQAANHEAAQAAQAALEAQSAHEKDVEKFEAEKAVAVAGIEAAMEANVVVPDIKSNLKAQPASMEEWAVVIGFCLKEGILKKEWCDKNLSSLLTAINKLAKEGTTLTGLSYVEVAKI